MIPEDQRIILDARLSRQDKFFRWTGLGAVVAMVGLIAFVIVLQYQTQQQINSQVDTIVTNQSKNRSITDGQNGVILGYLICIGKIAPQDRTDEIIKECVNTAVHTDILTLQGK